MTVLCGEGGSQIEGEWWPVARIEEAGLPTAFAKAARRGLAWRQPPRRAAA